MSATVAIGLSAEFIEQLPSMALAVEAEWRRHGPSANAETREALRQLHSLLGRLLEPYAMRI
jgi:hypothetical protein